MNPRCARVGRRHPAVLPSQWPDGASHRQLADRKVKVKRPRLRHKSEGEVKIPAYEMLRQDRGLGQHVFGALIRGVSTREYQEVLPQMAKTVGVSRAISRKAVEASAEQLKQLQEPRWEDIEFLVIHIDGQRFGQHHVSGRGAWMQKASTLWESSRALPRTRLA
jgi:hypothetical protein